jgi:hypothetical protein
MVVEEDVLSGVVQRALEAGRKVGVFAYGVDAALATSVVFVEMGLPEQAAHDLYETLRRLDEAGCDVIVTLRVEEVGIGCALSDRLRRAAVGSRRSGD